MHFPPQLKNYFYDSVYLRNKTSCRCGLEREVRWVARLVLALHAWSFEETPTWTPKWKEKKKEKEESHS